MVPDAAVIEILRCGALCSVQDLGRFGHRHQGLCQAGVMHDQAFHRANLLLDNPENAAVIEIGHGPLEVLFHTETEIVLAGIVRPAELVEPESSTNRNRLAYAGFIHHVMPGTVLRLQNAMPTAMYGVLAVKGGIQVPEVLGSRSLDFAAGIGGHEGRFLRKGDLLPIRAESGKSTLTSGFRAPTCSGELRCFPGPEYDLFTAQAQQIFWQCHWQISAQSNRMGCRLSGIPLNRIDSREIASSGIIPGVVQVPPDGQPILLCKDAQITGGYPRIATVLETDLWQLASLGSGATVRFRLCTEEEARKAEARQQRYRQHMKEGLELIRKYPPPRQKVKT